MSKKILIIGSHGVGDCLLSIQCAYFLRLKGISVDIKISARNEIFNVLKELFPDFNINQIHERYGEDNKILHNNLLLEEVTKGYNEFYYIIPDLLYRNPYAFDFKKYNTTPEIIRSIRTLLKEKTESEKIIYCGLNMFLESRMHPDIKGLLNKLAEILPDYNVYFPHITKWNNKELIYKDNFENMEKNVIIDTRNNFSESLKVLKKSQYFICGDNGVSHISYHLGINGILLDDFCNNMKWISRWRDDAGYSSIPLSTSPLNIARIVKTNLEIPQTTLLPRRILLSNPDMDWSQELLFKY